MQTHTPGPWRLVKFAGRADSRVSAWGVAYGSAGNRLASVDGEGNSSDRNDANARLIAAAPDLLFAACVGLAMLDPENQPPQYSNAEAREIIRAAISKAEAPHA